MSSHFVKGTELTVKELAELSVISAVMFAGKEAMAAIPNVHPLCLIIIAAGLVHGWKGLYCIIVFNLLEISVYGVGIWLVVYFYTWPLLLAITVLARKTESALFWAAVAALFGLVFGALSGIPYIFISGFKAAFAYWIAGIPYDLIHGAANAVIVFFLIKPLRNILEKVHGLYGH